MDALLDGRYEGDVTIGELARLGSFGLGTTQGMNGELIAIDGEFWCAREGGRIDPAADDELTPFAVVVPFAPSLEARLAACGSFAELGARLDELPLTADCAAVRLDGRFPRLLLRTMRRQLPPYKPLLEIAGDVDRFELHDAEGTLAGFRFPTALEGVELPGYHLHFISTDRAVGGHVLELELEAGTRVQIDLSSELHLEVPAGLPMPAAHADPAGTLALRRLEND
jgi:acetolactate decarboxylase